MAAPVIGASSTLDSNLGFLLLNQFINCHTRAGRQGYVRTLGMEINLAKPITKLTVSHCTESFIVDQILSCSGSKTRPVFDGHGRNCTALRMERTLADRRGSFGKFQCHGMENQKEKEISYSDLEEMKNPISKK